MKPVLLALKNRLEKGEITQELYDHLAEIMKDPEPEPPPPPPPTDYELLRDYVLDLDYRLILMELGVSF